MKFTNLMMSAALAALVAGGALAQATATDPVTEPPIAADNMAGDTAADMSAPVFTSIEEMTVGDVLGMVAHDPEGDRIAEIDYVIDRGDGAEAVLGIGGFIGLGEYTVALPLSDFELSEDGAFFVLATDKETLKAQPEIDESGLESLPDDTPIAQIMPADDAITDAPAEDAMADEPVDDAMTDETTDDTVTDEPADDTMTDEPADDTMIDEPADDAAETETTQ